MAKIDDSVKKKVPELRFKGFTDDWEERKFADFIDVKSGKDYKHLNSGPIPVYGTGGYMLSVDRALSDIDAIGIGRKGTIDKPYLLKAPFWTVDTLFYAVPKQNIDLQFSLSIFKKINWKKFDESTGVPSLSKTVINSVGASVPCYEEQQKIGSFFKQLDKTIALHQRKLDLLKEQKKGYLQKMFPKNGEKVPELRFTGFADDWEERKLGEVATFLNGRAYKQDELLDSGKYKVLRVGNFYTNDSWYYSNMELGDKYYVDKGDLVYTWSATFGPHIWSGEKVIYHYHIWKVELSKFLDRNFTLQLLEADKARLLSSTNGSTMIHVTKGDMESKIVSIPNIDEQKQIGSFFKQLDETIALHQRKLDLLKEQKKGFLQKMFV